MIGVFDSGIGGLTVVRALRDRLPDHDIVYFGDTARTPYGTKSPETVIGYAVEDARILLEKGAQLLVVACNSASSVATAALKERFDLPIFEVISPAVAMSVSDPGMRRVGVIGTRATINSGVYEDKIRAVRPDMKVYGRPCPLLVPLVEEGWLSKPETRSIVKKYLHPLKLKQVEILILGCTHYPLLKELIQTKIGRRVRLIDSSEAVTASVQEFLRNNPDADDKLGKNRNWQFYVSDITEQFGRIAKDILGRPVALQHISL